MFQSVTWVVEQARLSDGRVMHLVVDSQTFEPHPVALEFVQAMYGLDRSLNTIRTYVRPVARFLTWCQSQGVDWRSVTLIHLATFKRHLETTPTRLGREPSAGTVSVALTAVCEFLRFAAVAGHVPAELPAMLVERKWVHRSTSGPVTESGRSLPVRASALRVRVPEAPVATVAPEVASSMLESARWVRDVFLLRLMGEGGLRIGEVLGLRLEDLHFLPDSSALGCAHEGAHLHVRRRADNDNGALAKSMRTRAVPVTNALVAAYRDYRYERDRLLGEQAAVACDSVLVNYTGPREGQSMTYSNAYQLVRRLGRRGGGTVAPHMFRHTAATAWVEAGTEVDVVQELLGHAHPSSTKVYLHPSRERMRAAVEAVASVSAR